MRTKADDSNFIINQTLKRLSIMAKIDFKKLHKELYNPSVKQVSVVNVPSMNFIMLEGKGDPNTSTAFGNAVEALYGAAYSLKFMLKKAGMAGVSPFGKGGLRGIFCKNISTILLTIDPIEIS